MTGVFSNLFRLAEVLSQSFVERIWLVFVIPVSTVVVAVRLRGLELIMIYFTKYYELSMN